MRMTVVDSSINLDSPLHTNTFREKVNVKIEEESQRPKRDEVQMRRLSLELSCFIIIVERGSWCQ